MQCRKCPAAKAAWVEAGVEMKKRPERRIFIDYLAEEAGFEPAVGITLRTLSRRMT